MHVKHRNSSPLLFQKRRNWNNHTLRFVCCHAYAPWHAHASVIGASMRACQGLSTPKSTLPVYLKEMHVKHRKRSPLLFQKCRNWNNHRLSFICCHAYAAWHASVIGASMRACQGLSTPNKHVISERNACEASQAQPTITSKAQKLEQSQVKVCLLPCICSLACA